MEPHLLSCYCRQGVFPLPVSFTLRDPTCQPPRHLVLGTPQESAHAGGDHTVLWYKEQHFLQHGFKEKDGHLRLCSLPTEDSCHPLPHRPLTWQITDHRWPVVVRRQYHPPKVSEGGHHLQGVSIGAKCPGGDRPLLLPRQSPSLLLRSLPALRCASVHPIQRPAQHQYFTQISPWVREVALLHYPHGLLDVPVQKVHLYWCQHSCPATTPFDWAGPRSCFRGKHHPESPGLVSPAFLVAPLTQPPFYHAVLVLVVC